MADTQLTDDQLKALLASSAPLNANGPSLLPALSSVQQAPVMPSLAALGMQDKNGQDTTSADALLGKYTPLSVPGLSELGDAPRPTVNSQQELDIEGDEDKLRALKASPTAQPRTGLLGALGYGRNANALYNKNRQDLIDDDTKNVLGERAGQSAEKKTDDDLFNQNLEGPVEDDLKKAQTNLANKQADQLDNGKFSTVQSEQGLLRINATTGEAQPVTIDGKPVGAPLKTEIKQLEIGGKPHQVLFNSQTGEQIKDLGETGEKPANVNVRIPGSTTMVVPDGKGGQKLITINPGDTVPTGALTTGNYSSGNAADVKTDKATQEARKEAASGYRLAQQLAATPTPTNDYALLMQFIGLTKPEQLGKLRLNQNEVSLAQGTRSLMGDLDALENKVSNGQSLTATQRTDMLNTIKAINDSKNYEEAGQSSGNTVQTPKVARVRDYTQLDTSTQIGK
jgi:hypothetical protein